MQKMETLWKPLFFIGNPAIPGLGNIILLHSGDSGVSYETIRVSAHLSLGLPSSLSKNKGFLNVSTVFAPPYQKNKGFPRILTMLQQDGLPMDALQQFPTSSEYYTSCLP
jgi:hypothetical protein